MHVMSNTDRATVSSWILIPIVLSAWAVGRVNQAEDDGGWPREINVPEVTIVMYQPQLETFAGDHLTARAAVSVTKTGETEPLFGAVWMSARVATDRDTRMVEILDVTVTAARFPNATEEQLGSFSELLQREIPKWDLSLSLDRLLTSLELAEKEQAAAANLSNEPPKIIFSTDPAILLMIDGEPKMEATENPDLLRVVNTPFMIIYESQAYYLYAGNDRWYFADDVMGDWQLTHFPPDEVAALAPPDSVEAAAEVEETDSVPAEPGPPPRIIVAQEPTELIVSDGAPAYTPISPS